ncbi:MAG: sigma factor-like helix-turn-helix DNA-binding protein [Pseudomonadota bacterium]
MSADPLSDRDALVLHLLDRGTSINEVARQLGVSRYTAACLVRRVRAGRLLGGRRMAPGLLTFGDIGELLGISASAVQQAEERALSKLRRHPALRALAADYGLLTGEQTS